MSRKHNAPHNRGTSNYKLRLESRGLSRAPKMRDYTGATARAGTPKAGSGK